MDHDGRAQTPTPSPRTYHVDATILGILGALGLALVIVPLAVIGGRLASLVLMLPVGFVGWLMLERHPELGFPLAIVVALIVPFSIGTGSESAINASVLWGGLLIGMWLIHMLVRQQQILLTNSPTIPPLLVWGVVSVLAFGFGQLHWLPIQNSPLRAQIGGLGILILLPSLFLVAMHRIKSVTVIEWMTWLLIGIGGVFVIAVLLPFDTRDTLQRVFQRAVFDSMFWTWIMVLGLSQAILNRKLKLGWRIAVGVVGAGALYYTFSVRESWISGWLPGLIGLVVVALLVKPKWVVIASAIGVILVLFVPGLFGHLFLSGDNQYSLSTRVEAWQIVLNLVKFNPVLGLGPANYYSLTPLYSIAGYNVSFNSHNNYIDILAQTGVLGLGAFIWFAVALARQLWSVLEVAPAGFARAFAVGAFGGFVGTLASGALGDWFLPFVYNVGLSGVRSASIAWLMLGAACAMGEFERRQDRRTHRLSDAGALAAQIYWRDS